MSQIIVCKNDQGIVLASDSKAMDFDLKGELVESEVDRLIPLTKHTAILTGGAGEGSKMCKALKDFVSEEGLDDIEDVYGAALPFLATEYERFMRQNCEVLPLDPIQHVHFILAGYSQKAVENPYRVYLIWTKKKLPQLDGDEISAAFSVPRSLRLEYKLNQFSKDNAPLDEILPELKKGLEGLAASQEEVGGPLSFGVITQNGFQKM